MADNALGRARGLEMSLSEQLEEHMGCADGSSHCKRSHGPVTVLHLGSAGSDQDTVAPWS